MAVDALLRVENLSVRFGAFRAIESATVQVGSGEIVGVIGPNGAGKSTLINAICGSIKPSSGRVVFDKRNLKNLPPHRRAKMGLVRTFQTPELFSSLSVATNIGLAARRADHLAGEPSTSLVADLSLQKKMTVRADDLSGGEQKLVDLVRAMAASPRIALLDEPVAGVPPAQRVVVLQALRRFVERPNAGALLIEHDMAFISEVCDRVYVMASGAVIAAGTWEDVSRDAKVIGAYLGTRATSAQESRVEGSGAE